MPKPKPTDATVSPGAAAESAAGAAPPSPNADGLPETAGADVAESAAESAVNDAGAGAATVDTGLWYMQLLSLNSSPLTSCS